MDTAQDPDTCPDDVKDGEFEFLRVDDMLPTDSLIEGGWTDFTVDKPALRQVVGHRRERQGPLQRDQTQIHMALLSVA
ncbi:hypothetical protein JS532_00575 [Bifidobacterium callimiconis]|uniref:hypothetical protein n=1 Tax=Bifidobacterium callimiconis TaxID=2306973 RepID=UPI001BDCFC11|nr:hypothetical protein [Bifidobacterium callimiconis]MBT1176065.1 hypothetical protein [Bifidobacterium callimiconis]